ncbi:hypothetical protein CES85_1171 [Ochrobactrum quorumnocens]|uniref:Uncharacterized protein n=1 Tax=Ochrobactrum quorumnocens TaxID=271865 RepID=A0A248UEH9_9HYPH|nr:hypothetical protein CES85_1171 [[Ochrobactrum] quorumnocens]
MLQLIFSAFQAGILLQGEMRDYSFCNNLFEPNSLPAIC